MMPKITWNSIVPSVRQWTLKLFSEITIDLGIPNAEYEEHLMRCHERLKFATLVWIATVRKVAAIAKLSRNLNDKFK